MIDTKQRILETARQLYNVHGLTKVSQRQIADEMGISPGNLTYHFKKKQELNLALYEELVTNFDQLFEHVNLETLTMQFFVGFADAMYDTMQRYRFFFVDIIQLMRSNEQIAKHYRELLVLRKQQFDTISQVLIQKGLLQAESRPGTYQGVFNLLQIVMDFYCSAQELNPFTRGENDKAHFSQLILQVIAPYLTESGKSSLEIDV